MPQEAVSISVTDNMKGAPQWDLPGDIDGVLTIKDLRVFVKDAHEKISYDVLREEQAKGFDKKQRNRIDNKWDQPVETVRPFGKVEFFARIDPIVAIIGIYNEIIKRSIVDTGFYRRNHRVVVNGVEVASTLGELKAWQLKIERQGLPANTKVRFINVTPYAARLEFGGKSRGTKGKNKGKTTGSAKTKKAKSVPGGRVSKPNGTYVLAHRVARAKFKSVANFIKFSMVPNGSYGVNVRTTQANGQTMRTSYIKNTSRKSRLGRKYSGPYVYPSIVLDFNEKGTTEGAVYR